MPSCSDALERFRSQPSDTAPSDTHYSCHTTAVISSQEHSVTNNNNPNQKQPGEKQPGTFHYNPGNMSEKSAESREDKREQQAKADRIDKNPKTKKVDN